MKKLLFITILFSLLINFNSCRKDRLAALPPALTAMVNETEPGESVAFRHDRQGRLQEVSLRNERSVFQYESDVVTITRLAQDGIDPVSVSKGNLDKAGRLQVLEGWRRNESDPAAGRFSYWFIYNTSGQLITIHYTRETGQGRSLVTTHFEWANGNVIRETVSYDGNTESIRTYTYDSTRINKVRMAPRGLPEWADGLLGVGNRNLPVGYTDSNARGEVVWQTVTAWELDDDGYPKSSVTENCLNGQVHRCRYTYH